MVWPGQRVLIVGAGVTGRGALVALESLRSNLVIDVCEDDPDRRLEMAIHPMVSQVVTKEEIEPFHYDVVISSPGVPLSHPAHVLYPDQVISEIDLGYSLATEPIAGVTGTNGKTTVSSLVAAMLGDSAVLCGNAGTSFASVARGKNQIFVVEASSFQLASSRWFAPNVATFLNLSPDHLDWHGGLENYFLAKASMFTRLAVDSVAVLNDDDTRVANVSVDSGARVVRFSLVHKADAYLSGHNLVGPGGTIEIDRMARRAPHDLANVLAAWLTADALGARPGDVKEIAYGFSGLPYRLELVAKKGGTSWWNDSKATTPESVVAALGGFERVILIAGGKNKGLDLSVIARAATPVVAVVAIGQCGPEIAELIRREGIVDQAHICRAASMAEAVHCAGRFAREYQEVAVLLSPGATSYDWYLNYQKRGDDFAREVTVYLEQGGSDED